ncbi:DEAD/DEAH box helicase family protein, partial [Paracoccaceae bacterium]|nr:DEAD/DEAH box helicase family protein [Paracoccaceae bacterium]
KEFIKSIQNDGNDGKAFERFCKWFLINDPYCKTQVDKAWLWNEWPERWGPDCGIDLIFKHKNGDTWAVQAKCYDEKYSVSKTDMDSFLTESSRALIKHRLLMASTNNLGRNAQRACAAQEKPVTLYMLKDFEAAQVEYPVHISDLEKAKSKIIPTPDPHQIRARDEIVSKFEGHDRGQLIMACGTGKTFTTLWIKEALAAQTTLVLVPSLNLLSQTLNEWAFAAKDSFDVLCVCSDKTVGKRDKEDMALGEAPFSVTSDLSVISDFISNDGHKVIFCTYQSSDLIAEVQSDNSINPFDLVIADEAHRCSGKSDAAFSKVLDDEAIRATKRLFTTATPRLYSSSVKQAAADRGIEVYGMDDEAVFGPVLHTLTFGQAITEDLLNDYQVVIVGVDQPMIKEWIENQELLGVNPNNVTDARTLAAKIGLLKAIKDYDLTRVISFHSRVNAARDFAAEVSELVDLIEPSNRPKGTLWSSFVSGAIRTTDRIIEIGKLKSLESADIGVLANARCLSEGVDVPSLDGIAFIDPKGSQVDIIQAVGRAIRKVRGASTQTRGTIVLPVFIEEGDDAEARIEASNFKPVWDVLKALRSHDEVLAENLDQYRTNMAKKSGTARQTLDDRIIFDLPITVDPNFSSALSTVLVEATTASWEFWFGLLQMFHEREGHCLVIRGHKEDGFKLGVWVGNQRRKTENLTPE